ncbi:MAG: outer membrane beta-barrel protein [Saprospiraceae bacterium]|mgnify:FL=1|nr:outer membrane beta-barrel protein [Candidatus Opimibacter skivensis]MBL0009768.1 outer membrane beta-barrel protein [Candidatus Opimibacter skivensis]MBP6680916.1 outer membrane beta-barrel protein [Saprospiraceae bacterium]
MKSFLLCTAFLAVTLSAAAQTSSVTLLTFAGYTFADKFQTYYGYGKIQDAFQWGAGLEFGIQPGAAMELIYLRSDPEAYYDESFSQQLSGKIGINYIMLGATRYAPVNETVSAFGTFDMGVGFTSNIAETLYSSNVTKFAIGGRLGLKVAPNDKVSLRIHAQILSPVQWIGGGAYFGTGGSGASVSTGSTIWQFNLGGSLNYRIK